MPHHPTELEAPTPRRNEDHLTRAVRYRDAIAAIQRAGRADIIEHLRVRGVRLLNLPLLLHYGRSDLSVSFFGATVSPEGIRQALHAVPALDGVVESFQAFNAQNNNDDPLLVVAVELTSGRHKATLNIPALQTRFAAELGRIDRDFATVYSTAPIALRPEIRLYDHQTGPFQDGHRKIKHTYVAGVIQYDDIPE
jgi:phenylacetate-CoA ligase